MAIVVYSISKPKKYYDLDYVLTYQEQYDMVFKLNQPGSDPIQILTIEAYSDIKVLTISLYDNANNLLNVLQLRKSKSKIELYVLSCNIDNLAIRPVPNNNMILIELNNYSNIKININQGNAKKTVIDRVKRGSTLQKQGTVCYNPNANDQNNDPKSNDTLTEYLPKSNEINLQSHPDDHDDSTMVDHNNDIITDATYIENEQP